MPNGKPIIMKTNRNFFRSNEILTKLIDSYFIKLDGGPMLSESPANADSNCKPEATLKTVVVNKPEPPTLSGLALHLGFESRQAFEAYELNGRFSATLKRARLMIQSVYEKKLHQQAPTGAVFALKSMGWVEKNDLPNSITILPTKLTIEVIETGLLPASSEHDVTL